MFNPATTIPGTRAPAHPRGTRGFLFLRRFPHERIVVIDRHSLTWIEALVVDPERLCAKVSVSGNDEPLTLDLYDEVSILQGDGTLRLHAIGEQNERSYASLGLRVPRSIVIRREELIKGLSREELLRLAR